MRDAIDAHGSYLAKGPRFSVLGARGNLWHRQMQANSTGCVCYVEQHMNSTLQTNVNYAIALVARNASEQTKTWARRYTQLVAETFGIPDRGLLIGPERGGYNLRFLKMPALLAEPGFISNMEFAGRVRTGEGLDALGRCLVTSIAECFTEGLVGLSVGHGYRDKPDSGALVRQGDILDPAFDTEVEINDSIVTVAEEMLLAIPGAS